MVGPNFKKVHLPDKVFFWASLCFSIGRETCLQSKKAPGRVHIVSVHSEDFLVGYLSCLPGMRNFGEVDCGLITPPILLLIEVEVNINIYNNKHTDLAESQNLGTLFNYLSKPHVEIGKSAKFIEEDEGIM